MLAAPVHWPKMLSRQRECAAYVQTSGGQLISSLAQNGQELHTLTLKSLFGEPPRKDNMITKDVDIFTLNVVCMLNDPVSNEQHYNLLYNVRALNITQACLHKY